MDSAFNAATAAAPLATELRGGPSEGKRRGGVVGGGGLGEGGCSSSSRSRSVVVTRRALDDCRLIYEL